MCLQDIQLARAARREEYQYNFTGAVTSLILPSNPQRILFTILGPNTGSFTVRLNGFGGEKLAVVLSSNATTTDKSFGLYNFGNVITTEIWINTPGAINITVYDYSLPLDPDSLKRLAETGKW